METQPPEIDTRAPRMPVAELEQLGEAIAELSAHLEAATTRLLSLIREFDAQGGWTGFRSCAAWLGWKVGLTPGAAREKVRVARALGALPQLAAALGRGELSYAKVRALTRIATLETEARLLALAQAATASQVEQVVRGWRRVNRAAEAEEATRRYQSRALTVSHDDGMVVVRGRLEPEAGALLLRALEAAREALGQPARGAAPANPADPTGEAPTGGQRQADALALLAETALRHGLDPGMVETQMCLCAGFSLSASTRSPRACTGFGSIDADFGDSPGRLRKPATVSRHCSRVSSDVHRYQGAMGAFEAVRAPAVPERGECLNARHAYEPMREPIASWRCR